MKCINCGYEIPSGELYCKRCGEEVRIVPDYNPLDDMLTAQIKVAINENGEYSVDEREYTRNIKNSRHTGRTSSVQGNPQRRTVDEREARRRQAEKRREMKRKKRRRLLIIMASVFVVFVVASILIYQNSYSGIVKKGNKSLLSSEYVIAQECFEKAINKKPEQPEAYTGLSKVFIAKSNLSQAEQLFLDAVASYPDNDVIYEACIQFYLDTDQALKIPKFLSKANDKVKDSLSMYIVEKPSFSLDEKEVYDDVQQLTLTSDEKLIYFTTDGTDPTFGSTKYTEPIQLDEGETIVKAMAVNKKGVPGLYEAKTYVIELPIEEAPAISPSTGQYNKPMKIEIKVPEGYTAYYTMDGSTPTTASKKYSGPINMPESDTLFKAILVNASGRSSGVTTRNYILDIQEDEE